MHMFATWFEKQRGTSQVWLEDLHKNPEIGFEEHRTSAYVAELLKNFGYDVVTGVGGTGVVATLVGANKTPQTTKRCVAFRAELDALPMQEMSKVGYSSTKTDRFHGCGHDGHMVTALTAAAYLAQDPAFDGVVRFIFQPAEELLTGARAMIADGLLDRFPFDEVYALHNSPDLKRGEVGIPMNAALSSADDIDITIHATGTHGSMPHIGQDAILAAAHLIGTVQQAVTRLVDSRDAAVISFGKVNGGTARNTLPDQVQISGTMRTNAPEVRNLLENLLQDVSRATEATFGVAVLTDVKSVAPVTVNNPTCAAAVVSAASQVVPAHLIKENARNLMASEDFSEFSARIPGAYFFVGQGGYAPHHPEFVFDNAIIPVGAEIFVNLAKSRTSASLASEKETTVLYQSLNGG